MAKKGTNRTQSGSQCKKQNVGLPFGMNRTVNAITSSMMPCIAPKESGCVKYIIFRQEPSAYLSKTL